MLPPIGLGATAATSIAVTVGPSSTRVLQEEEDEPLEEPEEQADRVIDARATARWTLIGTAPQVGSHNIRLDSSRSHGIALPSLDKRNRGLGTLDPAPLR